MRQPLQDEASGIPQKEANELDSMTSRCDSIYRREVILCEEVS